MVPKTTFITVVELLISQMPVGTLIKLQELYKTFEDFLSSGGRADAPDYLKGLCEVLRGCASRGDLPNDPRYKNDIRWAIRHLKDKGILKHVGTDKSGEWLRI
jgi:hypothetical protein